MKNLKISAKLGFCFAILFAALLALGSLSIVKLSGIGALAMDIAGGRLEKLDAAAAITTAAVQYRADEADHILAVDGQHRAIVGQDLRKQRDLIDQKLAWLDQTVTKPEMRAAMGIFKQKWTAYLQGSDPMLALSGQDLDPQAYAAYDAAKANFDAMHGAAAEMQTTQSKVMTNLAGTAEATYVQSRNVVIGSIIAVAILVVAMLAALVRGIAHPLSTMSGALNELAAGKTDAEVPVDDRRDEVGDLATAMKGLRDQLAAAAEAKEEQTRLIVGSIGDGLDALARGDLTARIDTDLTGPFAKLKTDFNKAIESLRATIGQVARSAGGIHTGAGEVQQASDDLSQRTEQQAASLEQTAAAMDEITTTVRKTADDAVRANQAVRDARAEAETSGEVVTRAVDAMGGIERSSREISEIITVIDGIAFQTNLLALNAGVEAARAGDAGKGFAVVASEVRALAQRSAEAAKDVKTRILASSEQVEAGVTLVSETGKALERIAGRIGDISGLISGIAEAAEQQAAGLAQVNTAVGEMDSITQQNAARVEEATAAARNLAGEADELARQVDRFRMGATAAAPRYQEKASPVQAVPRPLRQVARPVRRAAGGASAAVAVASDDWSEF